MKLKEKTAKAGTCRGLEFAELKLSHDSTVTGGQFNRPRIRVMEAEAEALEAAAEILAGSRLSNAGLKWLTVWRYANGFLSFEGCAAAFASHPEWTEA